MTDTSDIQRQRKQYRQRNSDGRDTFEGSRSFSPPAFDETDATLPDTPRLTNPDDATQAKAIRWTHVFDPALVDPDE